LCFSTGFADKGRDLPMIDTPARPIFILSFRQRDELSAVVARAGWRTVAARRSEGAERRLVASGAAVALIDARGAVDEGLAVVRAIVAAGAGEGRALFVLVSRGDVERLGEFRSAGATHFLASPMREAELVEALHFAEMLAERITGGWIGEAVAVEALGWRYDPRERSLQATPAFATALGLAPGTSAAQALRIIDRDLRDQLAGSLRRLARDGSAVFAHDVPGIGRVVEHLQRDVRTGRLHALVEPLGDTPDASAATRELFPRRRRSIAALARDLPGAIERDEIEIVFQPQAGIADGRIVGVEALARWRHPRLGEVGADALLAAADRAGLAMEVSAHLQTRALDAVARWPAALAHLRVAINITADDVAAPDSAASVLARIAASGVAPERITLEITESGLLDDLSAAAAVFAAWQAAGCRIAIDDFGTGYSSLAYLQALPLDYLKMDKALTAGIAGSARDRIVVRGVIAMGRSLGLAVIAEGVETEAQRALLEAEACDLYQGYLCARGLDPVALAAKVTAP
jgi:EAL domain-containing protein (putative c-di-GMP-specific phosphodiesterase class I)